MDKFWSNIIRYPRFLVSSSIGLILVIVTPFKNLFKNSKLRIILILFVLLFFITLYNIIINMIGL